MPNACVTNVILDEVEIVPKFFFSVLRQGPGKFFNRSYRQNPLVNFEKFYGSSQNWHTLTAIRPQNFITFTLQKERSHMHLIAYEYLIR